MVYKTIEGILQPDGHLVLPAEDMPTTSVRVMVTLLEDNPDAALPEVGDYLAQLTDYEERLARGEVRWH